MKNLHRFVTIQKHYILSQKMNEKINLDSIIEGSVNLVAMESGLKSNYLRIYMPK